jgi:pilus assembly protein CpaF
VDEKGSAIPRAERSRLVREIYHNIVGLGPLEPLLEDPGISEIMVTGRTASMWSAGEGLSHRYRVP